MCLALYIASNSPLTIIPWNEKNPSFHVTSLLKAEEVIKTHLNLKNIVYAGSYEGCGCAFNYGREYPEYENDSEELHKANNSYSQLCEYLYDLITQNILVQILCCWEGEQKISPSIFREIKYSDLRKEDFFFIQNELITIKGVT